MRYFQGRVSLSFGVGDIQPETYRGKKEEKTAMWELGNLRSAYREQGRLAAAFFEPRQGRLSEARGILSRGERTVSPYWYIRGRTPRCRIRRWCTERAPGFSRGFAPWGRKAFWPRASGRSTGGPAPLTALMITAAPPIELGQSPGFRQGVVGLAYRLCGA
jgi:hypothetical protein